MDVAVFPIKAVESVGYVRTSASRLGQNDKFTLETYTGVLPISEQEAGGHIRRLQIATFLPTSDTPTEVQRYPKNAKFVAPSPGGSAVHVVPAAFRTFQSGHLVAVDNAIVQFENVGLDTSVPQVDQLYLVLHADIAVMQAEFLRIAYQVTVLTNILEGAEGKAKTVAPDDASKAPDDGEIHLH